MTGSYIDPGEQISARWLTDVLRQSGVLPQGEVISFEQRDTGAFNSQTHRLVLRYSSEAPPTAPGHVVIKRNAHQDGFDEVTFYNCVAQLPDHPNVTIPCYAAARDKDSGDSYLLFEDLSETHAPPVTRDQQIGIVEGVPSQQAIEQVVDTLARLHAYWWEHPLLATNTFEVGYWSRNRERFEQYHQRRQRSWRNLLANNPDWIPGDVRELYESVLQALPAHWERYLEPRFRAGTQITLVHGDAYFANYLTPKNDASGPTYLLDWQSPSFDLGAYDLANLCAAFWTSEQRQQDQREQRILRRYLAGLHSHGVNHYSWDDLLLDYRHGLVFWLLMPVQDGSDGSQRSYWWPKMQCLVTAFREWDCRELLGIAP
ncbi:phosphotransferase [Dictyobacter aurantiacus]|uniref:Aminoglycoside phosphotransferase n=1 Tax=Dictyobacter aurantiacus TaxID=1936993 RepID=A0A401ZJJ8_9CHLR|nr:phosphotransferase [Dictyobacter aurantiacus]GCE07036.1 aminoglycoside phosphotransferase [Dictyobacter aurantiacus]